MQSKRAPETEEEKIERLRIRNEKGGEEGEQKNNNKKWKDKVCHKLKLKSRSGVFSMSLAIGEVQQLYTYKMLHFRNS